MAFTKMHGAGNDYIYVNTFTHDLKNPEGFARRFSDRHKGIGSDGLVLIGPSKTCDLKMRMYNADGSEGRMCGNASRCIAKYAYEKGLCRKETMTMETLAGERVLHVTVDGDRVIKVTVEMGEPRLHPAEIPMIHDGETFVDQEIECAGQIWRATAVCTGPAHLVIFTDTPVDELDLAAIGPLFENHPLFPDRVNTDFVNQLGSDCFQMRVWERGSGETLACGTGASAVAVAAVLTGRARRGQDLHIRPRGGELFVTSEMSGGVSMRGGAEEVFEGTVEWDGEG
ncbi:MAG: diaminopimelate epimerase [Clostridia bacterium]|nr:diaminopimelate epimerase [Clostridia bacterium]